MSKAAIDSVFRYTYAPFKKSEIRDIREKYEKIMNGLKWREGFKMKDQEFIVQKIRTQYTEKEHTQLDELKALDRKVSRPANVFAYVFGSVSAIIMGSGMSLVMTDIGSMIGIENPMIPGIVIGIAGMVMAIVNYPIYKKMLSSRRHKYADQILELSEKLLK